MFEKLKTSKLFFWSTELLVIATLVLVSSKIGFIFKPFGTFFSTMFAPILIAGFLFYMLNPLVKLITKTGLSRNLSIGIVFLILIGAFALMIIAVIPNLVKQIAQLVNNMPEMIKSVENWVNDLATHPYLKNINLEEYFDKMDISIGSIIQKGLTGFSSGFGSIVSSVASVTITAVTVPFILFYMLKDGDRFIPSIKKYLPSGHENEVIELLSKMSNTISAYISGQAIECLFVAVCTFIGYQVIGIPYAFLFGCIAGMTNMIPYIGPYLGLAPAVIVTVFTAPFQALLACIVVLVVQQVDGNIIYPNVIGKSLEIHPLTIIIVLLVAGNIAGLLGMILGVPFYAVCKTIFVYIFDIVKLNKSKKEIDIEQP